jgi:pimeloyl-ACP methyl ester carboxylesterase
MTASLPATRPRWPATTPSSRLCPYPDGMTGRGSVVLVHGGWSNPEDWYLVRRHLEELDLLVETPDLPSHRSAAAGLVDDAAAVRLTIRSCPPPVVVVGWSYGGMVIGVAAAGEPSVARLVYVAAVPVDVREHAGDLSWMEADPYVIVRPDGTNVLDNDQWPPDDEEATFPAEIIHHLRRHPRRPVSTRIDTDPVLAAAWRTIRTTVLLGRDDDLVTADERAWVTQHVEDVRLLETDHFIVFRQPEAVVAVVQEALHPR